MTAIIKTISNIIRRERLSRLYDKEFKDIEKRAIPYGKWHFERCVRGVKPIKGEYDPNNPAHIRVEDVITIKEF